MVQTYNDDDNIICDDGVCVVSLVLALLLLLLLGLGGVV
jgi:hypothetical protein